MRALALLSGNPRSSVARNPGPRVADAIANQVVECRSSCLSVTTHRPQDSSSAIFSGRRASQEGRGHCESTRRRLHGLVLDDRRGGLWCICDESRGPARSIDQRRGAANRGTRTAPRWARSRGDEPFVMPWSAPRERGCATDRASARATVGSGPFRVAPCVFMTRTAEECKNANAARRGLCRGSHGNGFSCLKGDSLRRAAHEGGCLYPLGRRKPRRLGRLTGQESELDCLGGRRDPLRNHGGTVEARERR
jgi:hypothetical protein